MPAAEPSTQRLFFALWPDPEVRAALAALIQRRVGDLGRAVVAENLHLTLAFVGGVTAEQRACMEAAASTVHGRGFAVTLDRLGFWPKPRILWAGATEVPSRLGALATDLNTALTACGYQPEPRPFQAHITLARKASGAPGRMDISPIHWPVRDFCLVESVTGRQGSEYHVLRRWPLAG